MKNNKIYVDDCIGFLKKLDDDSVDMVLCSPPYDSIRTYAGIIPWDWNELGYELQRVIKPGRAIVMVIQDACIDGARTGTSFRMITTFLEKELRLWECLIFHRIGALTGGPRFRLTHEYMPVFFKGPYLDVINEKELRVPRTACKTKVSHTRRQKDGTLVKNRPNGYDGSETMKKHETIFSYTASHCDGRKEKLFHPATYPDKLAADMITAFSNKGDLVLDCFMGSGTTGYIAKMLDRDFIGCDVSEEYVTKAMKMIKNAQKGFEL